MYKLNLRTILLALSSSFQLSYQAHYIPNNFLNKDPKFGIPSAKSNGENYLPPTNPRLSNPPDQAHRLVPHFYRKNGRPRTTIQNEPSLETFSKNYDFRGNSQSRKSSGNGDVNYGMIDYGGSSSYQNHPETNYKISMKTLLIFGKILMGLLLGIFFRITYFAELGIPGDHSQRRRRDNSFWHNTWMETIINMDGKVRDPKNPWIKSYNSY